MLINFTQRFKRQLLIWPGLVAYIFWLDWGSLKFGLLSDQYVLFARLQQGSLLQSFGWDGSWSYTPIVSALNWLEIAAFGRHESGYQIVDVLLHCIVVILVFELGRWLFGNGASALLAAILFGSSASYYEVRYWAGAGSFYEVTAILYLLAILSLARHLESGRARYQVFFVAFVVLAMLSDETGLSLVPVCVIYYALLQRPLDLRKALRLFALPSLFVAGYIGLKLAMSLHTPVLLAHSAADFIFFLNKALLGLALYRGDSNLLNPLAVFGTHPDLAFLWLVIFAMPVVAMLIQFNRFRLELFLAAWAVGQLLMINIAAGINVRHIYLPCIPFSILMVSLVGRLAEYLAVRVSHGQAAAKWAGTVTALALLVFLLPSYSDLLKAQSTFLLANQDKKGLIVAITQAAAESPASHPKRLFIVNATRSVDRDGFQAYLFQNGIVDMVEAYFPTQFSGIKSVYFVESPNNANYSHLIAPINFIRVVDDPGTVVVEYVPSAGISKLVK